MNAKKPLSDGPGGDESEAQNVAGQTPPPAATEADAQPKLEVAAKVEVPPKSPEPARKPDTPPKVVAKPPVDAKAQVKPKPKTESVSAGKAADAKSLAEVMKFDLRVKKRRRF